MFHKAGTHLRPLVNKLDKGKHVRLLIHGQDSRAMSSSDIPIGTPRASSRATRPTNKGWTEYVNAFIQDLGKEHRSENHHGDTLDRSRGWGHHKPELWTEITERLMNKTRYDVYYVRPREAADMLASEVSKLKYDGQGLQLELDVRQFSPSQLSVKQVDGRLVVCAKHEQRTDEHGNVSREFQREFTLQEDVDGDTMTASVSDEGYLIIRAGIKGKEQKQEKEIEIDIHKDENGRK